MYISTPTVQQDQDGDDDGGRRRGGPGHGKRLTAPTRVAAIAPLGLRGPRNASAEMLTMIRASAAPSWKHFDGRVRDGAGCYTRNRCGGPTHRSPARLAAEARGWSADRAGAAGACAREDAWCSTSGSRWGTSERIDAFHAVELGCNASLLAEPGLHISPSERRTRPGWGGYTVPILALSTVSGGIVSARPGPAGAGPHGARPGVAGLAAWGGRVHAARTMWLGWRSRTPTA